jgi:Zn-dependent protease
MRGSLKLGKAFGIPIFVHWTFALILGLVLYMSLSSGGGPDPLLGEAPWTTRFVLYGGGILVLFGCVLLHELGHALMARRFGIQTRDITLLPIGGMARLERMSEKPAEEILIAIAGPAVNVVIALVLGLAVAVGYGLGGIGGRAPTDSAVSRMTDLPFVLEMVKDLALMNVGLVVFNMVPAFPMDGGRVFRAVLSHFLGFLRATEIAAAVGLGIAGLMGLGGLIALGFGGSPMLILVGMFVAFAGQAELAAVRYRARRDVEPVDVLPADPGDLPAVRPYFQPPEPNFSGFTWDRHARVWIEWRDGRPVHACWTHGS